MLLFINLWGRDIIVAIIAFISHLSFLHAYAQLHDKNGSSSRMIQKVLLLAFGAAAISLIFGTSLQSISLWNGSKNNDLHTTPVLRTSRSVLDPPLGDAVALPSLRVQETIARGIYGGEGDAKHLGGFTEIDLNGVSPAVWKQMISYFGVKSLLDVGCGRGISSSWFQTHGVKTLCVEGSHDAIEKTIIPNADPSNLIEHDFSRGPWWPSQTVDAVWCVEFLEHVGRNYHKNYIPAFRNAALIFASHSHWGGWHHVEVHHNDWWQGKMESYGFRYSEVFTNMVRSMASQESNANVISPTGEPYNAQHVWLTMQVFINPAVAALPAHEHLFAEHGCGDDLNNKVECDESVTPLPKELYPLNLTQEMDDAWFSLVKRSISSGNKE